MDTGLPGQDEENGLGRVLGRVRIAEHVETDPLNDRPVPLDHGRERGLGLFVVPGKKLPQEVLVSPDDAPVTIPEHVDRPRC